MEEMEVNHVAEIQEKLSGMVGDRVKVKANMGRTRVIERLGIIKNVHPAVFIIEVDERRGRKSRQSYQYVDVLTGTVELFDPETGEHIFTPLGTQLEEQLNAGAEPRVRPASRGGRPRRSSPGPFHAHHRPGEDQPLSGRS